ncbi:MAG TPA: S8 family serine peptidase, partial [Tepidisphaeraceae bacterium]|nr:S8 family serine peptidase [Tepidisphaeraceae bacterium]
VAGVAAARGSNSLGVSGAAPRAALAGIRLTSGATTDAQEAAALTHLIDTIDVFNSSWGPADDGRTLEAPGPLTQAAIQSGAVNGRGGRGVVYVWAAGNGRTSGDNTNYDGYANSRYVIAVSAIDHNGVQASYSEPGAPILVAAYSSGAGAGITTTDRTGSFGYSSSDYTSSFGGTSAAAPLVSGIVALMLQANPNLTWRDVQHILARTARKNDPTDPGWTTNGAGLHINHKYGFGAVDADAAVNLARSWTNVGPEVFLTSGTLSVGQSIPDNNPTGLTRSFEVSSAINVEAVEVVVNITHTNRGQLRIVLVSPMGTESVLADVHNDNGDHYSNWTFTTRRNWNEISRGTWTLKVVDAANGTVGTLNDWKLNIYGTQADEFVHYVRVQANSSITGRDFGNHETIAPTVAASLFEFESAQRFSITFDEDMAAGSIEAADLLLENLTDATTIPAQSIAVTYDTSSRTATFTFTGFAGGILPDGNYRATLNAGTVSDLSGNTLASASISSFFVLGGDANRDRVVDIRDLSILAGNWGQSPRTFSQADFNYDGKVDTADLDILSANWQKILE